MTDGSEPTNRVWCFADAEFDEARRELRVAGQLQTVEAKPLTLLRELLSRGGEVATRRELLDAVWPDVEVVDQSLTTAVAKLRTALGPQGRAIIEAVHGIGYRIGVPIELRAAPERARLAFSLQAGEPVPNRPQWRLDRAFGTGQTRDVWLTRHVKTDEPRVFKFADTEQRLYALKREAALSRILHQALGERPDLVRVSEWNFETRPYFIESVYGGPNLAEWAQARGGLTAIPLAERIALLAGIARTVAAAHGVGVLHRDIKPTNILVDESGGSPVPRLVDFGSGRLTEAARLEAVTVTGLGLTAEAAAEGERLSGTLRYMAPEVLRGGPPTIAGDVYALGVLLYEIIVGDLYRSLTVGCEAEIADPMLRLDVLEAASRSPEQRLASAATLAERLESLDSRRANALRQEALQAETKRLAAKLDRARMRLPWLALASASLVLGLLSTGVFAVSAVRARDQAEAQAATVAAINRFLVDDIIAAADPDVSGKADVPITMVIQAAAARIDQELGSSRPQIRAALHAAMQTAFLHLTDYHRALIEGEHALAAIQTEGRPDPAGSADIQLQLTDTLISMGRLKEAGVRLASAEQTLASLHNARPDLLARLWLEKGLLTLDLPTYLSNSQLALKFARLAADLSPRVRDRITMVVGDAYQMLGMNSEAETVLRQLLRSQKETFGPADARPNFTAVVLATTLRNERRMEEGMALMKDAVPNLERALGPFARRTIMAKDDMAGFYYAQSKFDLAARLWTEVISGYEHNHADDPSEYRHVGAQINLAMSLIGSNHSEAAEQLLRVVIDEQRGKVDPQAPQLQSARFYLAYVLLTLDKPAEVSNLRRGLNAATLNMAEQESDWPGRLLLLDGRLALEEGNKTLALVLLRKAQHILEQNSNDEQFAPAMLAPMIREASIDNDRPQ